jgi:hypothetical protein
VVGPNEVLDLHGARAYAGARFGDPCRSFHASTVGLVPICGTHG